MNWIIILLTILGAVVTLIIGYYLFFSKNEQVNNNIKTTTMPPVKLITDISDPEGIKNGKYEAVPNTNFFSKNSNYWNISIKFNLDKFNNTLQSIIGSFQDDKTTTPALTTTQKVQTANNWGLLITPQRKLQWKIGISSWDLNNFGVLMENTLYEITIIYNNNNYTFSLKNLDVNKSVEKFNVVNPEPIILRSIPIITNSGFLTIGGKMNNKFLGTISEIKSFEIVVATTQTPKPTPYFILKDPDGIKNGKYNQISRKIFGLNSNNINTWTISILFTPINNNKYQGIIGNIYNISLPSYLDGWGFWISPAKYIHIRIQSWAHDLVILGELSSNIPYKLVINFNSIPINNYGTYEISLTNMNDNTTKSTVIEDKPRLIGDKGRICIGGNWTENPNNEKFDGIISSVEFFKIQDSITTTPPPTSLQPSVNTSISKSKTWSLDCNEKDILIDFLFKNKKAFNLKITETSAEINSYDGQKWGSPVIIKNTTQNNFYSDPRPLKFTIIFNVSDGFTIIYKGNKLVTYPNMFYIENANDLILQINPESDIIIDNNRVIIYNECNFGGKALELTQGNYGDAWLADRGYNDNVFSILIPEGMQVTAYKDAMWGGFQSEFGTYRSNVLCDLHSISGLIVKKI